MVNPYNGQHRLVGIWLGIMCFAVICMIFIGGLTRLSDAGLSITEWKPVSGVVPPLNELNWQEEFDKYKISPEFIKNNPTMELSEFKYIFWLEFVHRLAGRLTGLLYITPLLYFIAKGQIVGRNIVTYLVVAILFAAQGAMGWYMVKSGLVSDPHVSHYRLAVHLLLAIFIYSILFWQMMKNLFDLMLTPSSTDLCGVNKLLSSCVLVLILQIFFGALVAGLDAGLVYNSFPYMGTDFIPSELVEIGFNLNDPVLVQFIHRNLAYLLFVLVVVTCIYGIRIGNAKLSGSLVFLLIALILQMTAGIMTLVLSVPISLALMHQLGAVILLSFLLWSLFLVK